MDVVTPSQVHREYVVAGRSRPSAILAEGHRAEIAVNIRGMSCHVAFRTEYIDSAWGIRVPQDLLFEARGSGPSLVAAAETFANIARTFAAVMALSVNASMGDLDVELAYDVTPGVAEREFFQSSLARESLFLVPNRKVPVPSFVKLVDALEVHPEKQRLMRAIAQYDAALRHWSLGQEVLCVAHLFMGHEALKRVAVRHLLRERGMSSEELGREWSSDPTKLRNLGAFLEAEARRRLLFQDDSNTHRQAKKVSDGFEHGFEDTGNLRHVARSVFETVARYLRSAIVELTALDQKTRNQLLSFAEPRGPLRVVKYLWGHLIGAPEHFAAAGRDHPVCDLRTSIKAVQLDDSDRYTVSYDETMTAWLGENVKLKPNRYEAWDGSTLREQRPPSSPAH